MTIGGVSARSRGPVRRLVRSTTIVVGVSVLTLALTAGSAAPSGGGAVTRYRGFGINEPYNITSGPDGALWFVNQGNGSIGRITTSGVVTNYTGTGINVPVEITAGPD